MATYHSICTGLATSCSNMLWRHIMETNHFVCAEELLWKYLSLQQDFVAATNLTNSVWFDFWQHIAATKFCCSDKDFHKNPPVHTKQFRCDVSSWHVAATCCLVCTPALKVLLRVLHVEISTCIPGPCSRPGLLRGFDCYFWTSIPVSFISRKDPWSVEGRDHQKSEGEWRGQKKFHYEKSMWKDAYSQKWQK